MQMRQVQLCERDGQRESTSVKYTVNVMYKEREIACVKYSSTNVMYKERECMRQVHLCERDVQRQRERVHASSTGL